jgi:CHAT domain-containing protein
MTRACLLLGALPLAWGIGTPGCGPARRVSPKSEWLAELREAAGASRCGEGRLSVGLDYAPVSFREPCASDPGFASAFRRLERRLHDLPPADVCHGLGVLELLAGYSERAVSRLERCAAENPRDSATWNDLAAGRLWLVSRGDQSALLQALHAADQAITFDPAATAPWFNRAVVLSRLHLHVAAAAAWEELLRREGGTRWAAEAQRTLTAERRPSYAERWSRARPRLLLAAQAGDRAGLGLGLDEFIQPVHAMVQDELLPLWADRAAVGDEKAAAIALKVAAALGKALAARSGDRLIAAEVQAIEGSAYSPSHRSALIAGHLRLRSARAAFLHSDLARTSRLAFRAAKLLHPSGSPAAWLAELQLASSEYLRGDSRGAQRRLRRLLAQRELSDLDILLGRAGWLLGLCQLASAQPVSALHSYGEALARFERLGFAEDTASIHSRMAEALTYLGDRRSAWRHRHAAIERSDLIEDPRHLFNVWEEAALAIAAEGSLRQALPFRDEIIRVARLDPGDLQGMSFALMRRAEIRYRLGELGLAGKDLEAARTLAKDIGDQDAREWLLATLAAAQGMSWITTAPAAALGPLSQALTYHRRHGNRFFAASLHFARARAEHSLGLPEAEQDLQAGLIEMERQRESIPDETLRASYFEQAQAVLAEEVTLQWARGEVGAALSYHEQARARVLLDRLRPARASEQWAAGRGVVPLSAPALCAGLPPGVVLIEYAALADRLLVWFVRHDGIEATSRPVGAAALERKVQRLRRALEGSNDAELEAASFALADDVLAPLASRLRREELLVMVPDHGLETVPFALLRLTPQKYLIESHRFVVAPSASFYVRSLGRWRAVSHERANRALVVGDPAFDSRLFPHAPRLPGAASEAIAVASLYPHSALLRDRAATRERLVAMAGIYPVLHLGVHTFVDDEYPLFSRLALAPSAKDNGVLYGYEIQRLALPRTQVVVLASCETAGGASSPVEGVISMARSFLAAGAPVVVASLWSVDDELTTRVMVPFHRALRAGSDPSTALRDAQLQLLHDRDPRLRSPQAWAAFATIGMVAP